MLWGPPGTGKTSIARLIAGATRKAFEPLERGQRGREGRPGGRRAGPTAARRARPGHDPVPRRGAPVQPHPAGRAAPARGGGADRARRRHHREPLLLAHRAAAQPLDAVPARAGRCRRPPRPRRAGPRRRRARARRRAPHRSRRTRSTTSSDHAEGDARHALTSLDVAAALASEAGAGGDRARARRDRARDAGAALRRRRALRRDLRVHQEHPRLGRRRRALLAGPHARGGRGRPLHRPPSRDPGERGRRPRRPDGAADRGRRGAGGRVRRAPRGDAQPLACGDLPGQRAEVERRQGRDRRGARRRAGPARRRGPDPPAGRQLPGAASLGHGEGYVYPHDAPGGWAPQQYRPPEVADRVYWVPSGHGDDGTAAPRARGTIATADDREDG